MGQGESALRVFLVDDHPVVRRGLSTVVDGQADMAVVGEAADGLTAVEEAIKAAPDVVVMDLSLPKMNGLEATAKIKAALPGTRVLALTAHEEPGNVANLLGAGASGFLLKHAAGDELLRAIRAIAAGGIYIDPAVAAEVLTSGGPTRSRLSEREEEVLRKVAEGLSMKDIAAALNVSTRTLETYRSRAMGKLELRTRADIVQYALRQGWLRRG